MLMLKKRHNSNKTILTLGCAWDFIVKGVFLWFSFSFSFQINLPQTHQIVYNLAHSNFNIIEYVK